MSEPSATLAVILDDDFVRITPPTDDDSISVVDMKMFILACLTRRNQDPAFDRDMREWFIALSEDEIKAINKVRLQ
jgi:hypothetical protein